MPRFNRHRGSRRAYQLATKGYVNQKINETEWSNVYRTNIDLQAVVVNGGNGDTFDLYNPIYNVISQQGLWSRIVYGTDGLETKECDFAISYIRLHIRVATGENETSSAVSQTVRMALFRYGKEWDNAAPSAPSILTDVDAMPLYSNLYGEINGLWYDKTQYVHSWATDADTIADRS